MNRLIKWRNNMYTGLIIVMCVCCIALSACKQTSFVMGIKYKSTSVTLYASGDKVKVKLNNDSKKKVADTLKQTLVKPKDNIRITLHYARQHTLYC